MKYCVYVLESESKNIYYVGSTSNLEKRIVLHNSNKARWTKRYQPWVLRHSEEFLTRSEAVQRERFIKSLKNTKNFLNEVEEKLGQTPISERNLVG
jgi:putative endonuclease